MKNVVVRVIEATERGYVRIGMGWCEPYDGKYGKGIKVHYNNPSSTRYNKVRYYIVSGMTCDFYKLFCFNYHKGMALKYSALPGKRNIAITRYNSGKMLTYVG